MAKEHISREEACAVINDTSTLSFAREDTIQRLNNIHAADVVEVVRSKDCKHVMLSSIWAPQCCKHEMPVKEDDFCSFGERRDKE